VVGIMLSGFGTFWAGEGIGLEWPGADLAILGLLVFYAVVAGLIILALHGQAPARGEAVREL
jgi:uncharacterized membrane protein